MCIVYQNTNTIYMIHSLYIQLHIMYMRNETHRGVLLIFFDKPATKTQIILMNQQTNGGFHQINPTQTTNDLCTYRLTTSSHLLPSVLGCSYNDLPTSIWHLASSTNHDTLIQCLSVCLKKIKWLPRPKSITQHCRQKALPIGSHPCHVHECNQWSWRPAIKSGVDSQNSETLWT